MSFHESELSQSITQNSEVSSSCEYASSAQSEVSCDEGEGEGDGDGNGDHEEIMNNSQSHESEQDHEISEHDKISGKDSNEDNCEAFFDFVKMVEQDNEVAGSFFGQGDSET